MRVLFNGSDEDMEEGPIESPSEAADPSGHQPVVGRSGPRNMHCSNLAGPQFHRPEAQAPNGGREMAGAVLGVGGSVGPF